MLNAADLTKALSNLNAPTREGELSLGDFYLYDIDGNFLAVSAVRSGRMKELASQLAGDQAVLFVSRPGAGNPAARLDRDTAWMTCSYLIVGNKACMVDRHGLADQAKTDLLVISPETANVMLGLAAF